MIRRVTIKRFKRFQETTIDFPEHVILAGPNNSGKTTVLQAIATWNLALSEWRTLNDFQRHGGSYTRKPITRSTFSSVPLRNFDLLWKDRQYRGILEVEIQSMVGWTVVMEFIADSTEQIYVRPKSTIEPEDLREINLDIAYVPPMSGLSTDEPVFQKPYLEQRLGMAKPGEVLRNLIVQAHASETAWPKLINSIKNLFGYILKPPSSAGAYIVAEYAMSSADGAPSYDIASAGSGFQQVLMLLTFLNTRPASVLLLDEPDAHLHVILQDAIFGELRSVAAEQKSQLIIATHSEQIINEAEPNTVCAMLDVPRFLSSSHEQKKLIKSLGCLTNMDVMMAATAPGILYLEDYTDLEILRAWALTLGHPAYETLTRDLFWHRVVVQHREGASGIQSKEHYDALRLVREDIPGLEIVDGDAHPGKGSTEITGIGLQRLRWTRYEIESYLIHPTAISRFIEVQVGPAAAVQANHEMLEYMEKTFTKEFVEDPLGNHPLVEAYLEKRKARTEVIPPILTAGGLPAFPYQRYHEIAAVMHPDEIHPEVVEKLNLIQQAFRL